MGTELVKTYYVVGKTYIRFNYQFIFPQIFVHTLPMKYDTHDDKRSKYSKYKLSGLLCVPKSFFEQATKYLAKMPLAK